MTFTNLMALKPTWWWVVYAGLGSMPWLTSGKGALAQAIVIIGCRSAPALLYGVPTATDNVTHYTYYDITNTYVGMLS